MAGQTVFTSIDGVDFKIREPRPFDESYFSHKIKSSGLRYEVALSLCSGDIVWVYGSYPCGSYSDLRLARQAYVYQVYDGERTIADRGYPDPVFFILPNKVNRAQHRVVLARHETVNKRLRQFQILSITFRHSLLKHNFVFLAVANITQLILKHEQPLFSVI